MLIYLVCFFFDTNLTTFIDTKTGIKKVDKVYEILKSTELVQEHQTPNIKTNTKKSQNTTISLNYCCCRGKNRTNKQKKTGGKTKEGAFCSTNQGKKKRTKRKRGRGEREQKQKPKQIKIIEKKRRFKQFYKFK
ncbi:hypothetical protein RFI_20822 [Reticulomyxa filosa]|uniref:Uncharacterized protein n=1 Tax=Reticulomyxa filosa TaxID=46433 RepID=X6MTS6_RETFI|nr:hypothetical protein RFI_20822 [Reticulomyxa filosa]|eukprot:ETO16515.1 hypothetical protein RFI_20822 [Reticulomyxa filosa]